MKRDYKGPAPVMIKTRPVGGLIDIETCATPGSLVNTELHVSHSEINRDTGRKIIGFREVEGTGRYRTDQLNVHCAGRTIYIPASKYAVDRQVRRMRPQEFEQLVDIDARIATLQAERSALIKTAFDKGHVVPVGELRRLGQEWLDKFTRRKR